MSKDSLREKKKKDSEIYLDFHIFHSIYLVITNKQKYL